MKKAVVLLSGGLDSATCLAMAKAQGFECFALSFSYGQKHHYELEAAMDVAVAQGVAKPRVVTLDIGQFGSSALTDESIEIPEHQETRHIPLTYVPARNTVFLAIALSYAESLGAYDIYIGANAVDYSGYPDCRPEFIDAFQTLANAATKAGVEGRGFRIQAPLISLGKDEIIQAGLELGVDYRLTVSCYRLNAMGEACGVCDSCVLRAEGFKKANITDPTRYVKSIK